MYVLNEYNLIQCNGILFPIANNHVLFLDQKH